MKDQLGDRMKSSYENRTRFLLPRRTYTIIRIDGKAFHTYTKGLKRPFDADLIADMDATAAYLCKNIMGAKFAYVQSDEISILLTDFEDIGTQAWFDNNMQKMVSVAASMATSEFNRLRLIRECGNLFIDESSISHEAIDINKLKKFRFAEFDARIFQIPQKIEVSNYFIWRQQDATRNSISSVAQSLYSHKELNGVSSTEKQELIFQKGINWNDYSYREKRGGIISRVEYVNGRKVQIFEWNKEAKGYAFLEPIDSEQGLDPFRFFEKDDVLRSKWENIETPIFTQDQQFLYGIIPDNR